MFKDVFRHLNWMVKWRQVFWQLPSEWKLLARMAPIFNKGK